jgi:tellurite resistance protein TerC
MEFLFADWLGTPAWFWLTFFLLVAALTAFDLGVLHKEDREMGVAESLKLSAYLLGALSVRGRDILFAVEDPHAAGA